jgi:lipoyl(octanoyl) transferase
MEKVIFKDLGSIDYQQAWDYQTGLHQELVSRKRQSKEDSTQVDERKHYLLFCEHPHVYTLGKSGSLDHLLLDERGLNEKEATFYKINRGGDITYHGPGQIVGYPIFDLDGFFTDVHKYVRFLEEAVIQVLADYDIEGIRESGYTGVWLPEDEKGGLRKICAIGVHLSRWVSMHGFAFNVNTNLDYFGNIVPCGIAEQNRSVTSLQNELGRTLDIEQVKTQLKDKFKSLFGFEWIKK